MSLLGILFAILGLSFLIFIHELGHYLMAKRAGMKIEVFSIGMGKPIITWKMNNVRWQVCYLLFGGYVKISGMEGENGKEPHQIRGGFYSKKPIYRLLVAGAGPFVNISFALLIFTIIYLCGGQKKPFSQHTKIIGKVDESSYLYEEGVRCGDQLISLGGKKYEGFKDVLIQGMVKHDGKIDVVVGKQDNDVVNLSTNFYSPELDYQKRMYPEGWKSMGILSSGSYVVANGFIGKGEEFSPLKNSLIKSKDRIVYADGNIIYSIYQLADIVNRDIALVTVEREGKKLHLQVPRVLLSDLKLSNEQKDEFVDSKREMNLDSAIAGTYFIPYLISDGLYVKDRVSFLDDEFSSKSKKFLQNKDKILAVAGEKVSSMKDFYEAISERRCLLMVSGEVLEDSLWSSCDEAFMKQLDHDKISQMEEFIGADVTKQIGDYRFLKSSVPVNVKDFIEKTDPSMLETMKGNLDKSEFEKIVNRKTLFSGMKIEDGKVIYNPGPLKQAKDVVQDIFFSLSGLFSGKISPKHMSGPIGMVKIVHDSSKSSLLSGLYWLAMISLNLGFMNLLPIPVLDGGHICFTMYEVITKKRIKAKTMQRMVVPFVALIITFFIYVTFYDLIKVFS